MVCQLGMKVLLYRKSCNPTTNFIELRKRLQNFHESKEEHGTKWFSGTGSEAWLQEGTQERKLLCVWDSWTLCQGLKTTAQCSKCGEKVHLDRACRRQRDGGRHESMAMGPTLPSPDEEYWAASSYPVKESRHASGQWLHRSHSDEHRCVPGLCAHSISGHKSQRRGFQIDGQRLCEDQHTLKQRGVPMQTENCFMCAGLFFKSLSSRKLHGVVTQLHFREKKQNDTPKGISGKTNTGN